MNSEVDNYISDWNKGSVEQLIQPLLNVSATKRLHTTGSTCDAYETRYQGRHVFVKKLKEEHRYNDLYLQAFKKEYEIGVTLDHPSLPRYTDFFNYTIVMNYVDGETLKNLIERKDSWLTHEKSITKVLTQLLEAVQYLHRKNIIHSDLKPDNVILTNATNNVVVLDFDKCYTDHRDTSTGSSGFFDLPEGTENSPLKDFRGIGNIAKRLAILVNSDSFKKKLEEFSKLCYQEDADVETLLQFLNKPGESKNSDIQAEYRYLKPSFKSRYVAAGLGLLLLIGLFSGLYFLRQVASQENTEPVESVKTPVITSPAMPNEEEINEKLGELYAPVYPLLQKAETMLNSKNSDVRDVLEVLFEINEVQSEGTQAAYKYFEEKYPDTDATTIQMEVGSSKEFRSVSAEIARLAGILAERT